MAVQQRYSRHHSWLSAAHLKCQANTKQLNHLPWVCFNPRQERAAPRAPAAGRPAGDGCAGRADEPKPGCGAALRHGEGLIASPFLPVMLL